MLSRGRDGLWELCERPSSGDHAPPLPATPHPNTPASLAGGLGASPELLRLFSVEGLPTLVVIDAKGRIQSVSSGLTDGPELRRFVTPLLP